MTPEGAVVKTPPPFTPAGPLTGPAKVLVLPGQHSSHITSRLAPRLGGGGALGPVLIGLSHAAQLVAMDSSVSQIVDMATLAAYQAITR